MREIKFRAKSIKTNKWIYGSYVEDKEWAKHYIYKQEHDGLYHKLIRHEVNPKTVGQYTGLKDKNGKEIYEGNIVSWLEHHSEIVFSAGTFCLADDESPGFHLHRCGLNATLNLNGISKAEIIGNIYESPELLKEQTNE